MIPTFYTGFSDVITYKIFTSIIIKHALAYRKKYLGKDNSNLGMDYENQIFIVLVRLRLGLLEEDIAYRYDISQSTVSRMFRFWINVMYSYFIPIWPSREIMKKYMPECYISKYPSTRIILDGTEIFIEKPSDYTVQSSTYSVYKAHNTARGIIGITPNGFVCFISELYPGRTSEMEIILNSGLLEKLEPGDSVMADKGFTISKELADIDVDLNIPPFSYGNNQQFTDADETLTRDISVRVHVERIIRNVKLNRILCCSIPNTMADQLNQIWVVCCHLTNFRKKPLLDIKTKKK
ncbi:uncharacterized protein LOC123681358 [Harmonia axyridis]|uniref:uncharacterized protein LOC123681358 n=1 Tax=Harmonia axyridis TaxID=115357 RepID=UPI001E27819F|nr:uncharacterized protein LOC123681358 [Harmonia axyridis]